MSRRKRPARKKAKQRSHKRKKSHPNGTALLTLDQEPFIKKALATCRRLRTELRKKQERLTHFEEVETNAYTRWLNSHFGVDLTRIRELQEEMGNLDFIVEQLRMCEFYIPEKLMEVHEELFRRKKEGTLHLFVPPEPDDGEEDEELEDPMDKELRDAFDSVFEDIFGDDDDWEDDDFEEFESRRTRHIRAPKPRTHRDTQGSLKTLFRTLAKRLHPDRSDMEEGIRDRRWNELQTAYHQGDLEGLQRIEAVCDMDETGLNASLGLARLNDLAAYHQSHLRPIRQALRAAKRHIAFAFSKADTTKLAREIRNDFKYIQRDLKGRLDWLQRTAEEFRAEAARFNKSTQAKSQKLFDGVSLKPTPTPGTPKQTDARQMQFF
ncbi:MAG: hypothetical protein O3C43_13135 [Verrucomicrobia bacterium]|nr:hypothetical protein [Verrucomicrobiota bacterium]MDA1067437.1 hypothetical protein [Verrucomicrobiota bacterium]